MHEEIGGITPAMGNFLAVLLFMLPLSVDTFAVAATVGAHRLSGWSRSRISTIFAVFEGGTPLIGLSLGSSAGHAIGDLAEYFSGGLLILLGGYLWWSDDDDDEGAKARRLIDARGIALIGLALSISLDELAIGFSYGLGANLAAPATIIAIITIQAVVASQLGLSFGAQISERARTSIQRITGPCLIVIGIYPVVQGLIRSRLIPLHGAAFVSTIAIALCAVIVCHRLGRERTRRIGHNPALPGGAARPAQGTARGHRRES